MEPLVADLGEVLLGPWTMILIAVSALAVVAVGLPITIMKVLELVEALFARTSERFGATPGRVRRPRRSPRVVRRSRRQPSVPG